MAERGVAIESKEESLLFYCGYALFFTDDMEMTLIKRLIESKVFWYYIKNTSKRLLLETEQGDEREKMIADLYRVPYEMIK